MLAGLTTIADVFRTLEELSNRLDDDKTLEERGRGLLTGNRDMVSIAKELLVEPVTIATSNATTSDAYGDAVKALFKLFISYYAQAFNTLLSVDNLRAGDAIKILNKNKTSGVEAELLTTGLEHSIDDIDFLPIDPETIKWNAGMEAKGLKVEKGEVSEVLSAEVNLTGTIAVNNGKSTDVIKVTIPMLFKSTTFVLTRAGMDAIFSTRTPEKGFLARWDEWRSGGIGLFNLLTGNDLVREYKENRIKASSKDDTDSLVREMGSVNANNVLKLLDKGSTGLNACLLLTTSDAKRLEVMYKGSIDKDKVRNKVFAAADAIIMLILDDEWEKATLYIKGLRGKTIVTYKNLAGKKTKDGELTELFKALMLGNKPTF